MLEQVAALDPPAVGRHDRVVVERGHPCAPLRVRQRGSPVPISELHQEQIREVEAEARDLESRASRAKAWLDRLREELEAASA